jgi:hypothetical protein
LNITFHDKSFRDECNDQKRLIKHYGALRAKKIRQRLWRLIFRPADNPPSLKTDGSIDWKHVRTIEIIGIVDTHD